MGRYHSECVGGEEGKREEGSKEGEREGGEGRIGLKISKQGTIGCLLYRCVRRESNGKARARKKEKRYVNKRERGRGDKKEKKEKNKLKKKKKKYENGRMGRKGGKESSHVIRFVDISLPASLVLIKHYIDLFSIDRPRLPLFFSSVTSTHNNLFLSTFLLCPPVT